MEDFEKIKNEQEQNQEAKQEKKINEKPKNKKVLKISIASVAAVILVGVGIFMGTKLVGEKIITINNNGAQNSNMASNNNSETKTENTIKDNKEKTESQTKTSISNQDLTKLTNFLQDSTNYPFLGINYDNPQDLFKATGNEAAKNTISHILGYSYLCSDYSKTATKEQIKIWYGEDVNEDYLNGSQEVISEVNLIKFFKEKMNVEYPKETLREVFRYSDKLNGYFVSRSDAFVGKVTIKNGYKLYNKYYLTLSRFTWDGKDIDVVISEENGSYYFYSCTNDYEINQAIVQDLYEQKLEKYVKSSNSKEKISEYFVDLVNVVEKPEGLGYENTNGIFATVRYSVKPVSKENNWIAGNGKIEDDGWIREKSACVIVEKQGDKYVITSEGTGW